MPIVMKMLESYHSFMSLSGVHDSGDEESSLRKPLLKR